MDLQSILNTVVAAASCPGIQDVALKAALALSLLVGLGNSRKIRTISNTPALRDHLKKKK